jgi:hypothetical protein
MLRVIVLSIMAIAALLFVAAGYCLGQKIPFAQQWPLFEALRNTAAIIFAVIGAWLAIIYPERLKIPFKNKISDVNIDNGSSMGVLLMPAVHSTVLLVVLLVLGVAAQLLKQIPQVMEHVTLFRGLSFSGLVILTCWQIVIVVMTLFPAELVLSSSQRDTAQKAIENRFGKLRRNR